jgi:enoyl-CoA hydratase
MNALTLDMISAIHAALISWATDPAIAFVLVDGAGDRGLCAGGDIRAIYNAATSGQRDQAIDFLHNEYQLTYLIARYQKPFVVFMDGITMGGGIGISAHASHRIVTERSQLAMPETAIGFVPDVGGTYLLGTAPGEFGTWLALTGNRIGPSDAIACGLADLMVRSENLSSLAQSLETCDHADELTHRLNAYAAAPPPVKSPDQRAWINQCFAFDTVEEIFTALAAHPNPEANVTLDDLRKRSPTSLKVTLAALRNARKGNDLAACLQQEFRIAQTCLREPDFIEGIRAAIIDKDRNPRWRPNQLEDVTPEAVEPYFTKAGAGELNLP